MAKGALKPKPERTCKTEIQPAFYRCYTTGIMGYIPHRQAINPGDYLYSLDDGISVDVKELNKDCPNLRRIKVTTGYAQGFAPGSCRAPER